jgi:15-cis-phytoene synthase
LEERERRATVQRIAREGDPDRTIATLFAPRNAHQHLFALFAFNVELARIAEQVSESGLGEIRLQWWRESVAREAAGASTGNPVADAIGIALKSCALSRARIAALIDARSFDLNVKIMPDWSTLEAYLNETAGALFMLAAEIAGGARQGLEPAASAAGVAYGLTGLMRTLPVHAATGRVYLPADALKRHRTSPERILAGEMSTGLADLLSELRSRARAALDEALRHIAHLAPSERTAFLPLCLVDPYLAALENNRHDPLRQIANINPLYRLWRMSTWQYGA